MDRRAFAWPYARLSRCACDQSDKVEAQSPEFNHLVSLRVAGPELRAACGRPVSYSIVCVGTRFIWSLLKLGGGWAQR